MKIERLLSIIIVLLDKQIQPASALAATFEVTKRTIYRDIETLQFAGFPIVSYPGSQGGFGFIDSFKMHKFTFTDSEKQKIIEALRLQKQLLVFQKSDSIIKGKLHAIQDSCARHTDISLSSATLHNPSIERQTNQKLEALHHTLTKQQKIKISYITGQGITSNRTVL